jgi:hypothetical protein
VKISICFLSNTKNKDLKEKVHFAQKRTSGAVSAAAMNFLGE